MVFPLRQNRTAVAAAIVMTKTILSSGQSVQAVIGFRIFSIQSVQHQQCLLQPSVRRYKKFSQFSQFDLHLFPLAILTAPSHGVHLDTNTTWNVWYNSNRKFAPTSTTHRPPWSTTQSFPSHYLYKEPSFRP